MSTVVHRARWGRTITAGAAAAVVIALAGSAVSSQAAADDRTDQRDRFSGQQFNAPQSAPDAALAAVPSWDDSPAVEQRVEEILAQMTTEEKADLATGQINNFYGFYNNPIERLGIPAQTMADGPVGVRVANPTIDRRSTQLPSASALAATFDLGLARVYGDLLGREAHGTGHNVQLAPSADISRTPLWGRAFEGFGEDPLLVGLMSGEVIQGIQDNAVLASIKHPFLYNQETDRFNVDAQADERALQEIYARAFGIGIKNGKPGSAMCAFNKINGVYACENPLMNTLLKGQLGLRGFVMSDYNATPSTAPAANAGLDQEQPGDQGPGTANFGERLVAAVAAGEVSMERLDDMARRILRPMIGLGLFEDPPTVGPVDVERNSAIARQVAADGMVLLKNRSDVLPLGRRNRSIAVIGPDADNTSAQGGGSATVSAPTRSVSPLEGITDRAGAGVDVSYSPGTDGISEGDLLPGPAPVPSSVLTPSEGTGQGLSATYWSNADFSGDPHLTQVDPNANVNFGFQNFPGFNVASPKIPTSRGDFGLTGDLSARWTGTITAPETATYTLGLTARGDAQLYLDGELLVEHTADLSSVGERVRLTRGEPHEIRIEYSAPALNTYQGGQLRLFWQHPENVLSPAMEEAVEAADDADTAVVVVRDYETEGADRPDLALPKEQEQLIRRVARVNRRTVVVLETGAVGTTEDWSRRVRGIVQAWYPGQEQGHAIADVLWGDVNPGGKLPATLPRNERQVPTTPEGVAEFRESIFVGYRGFLEDRVRPSDPVGFGLSYTTFRYRHLDTSSGNGRGDRVTARFTVRNTGDRSGSEVAQVYVGRLPSDDVRTPPRQLAGFVKVDLDPGESKRVTVKIPKQALSYWDTGEDAWVTPEGRTRIYVGSSSLDSALAGSVRVR
ncbi:MAG: glycoside hydrolase family 3 C-terminal domain-containing protein [Aeromicrobium sp.]